MKIGLEIHVQLATKSKLFCGCPNKFVTEPNTNVCETCLGLPGSKPRLNKKAVDYAMKIACALNCSFPKEMFFSRKSYFYPDMSKNFQITQYEIPVAKEGFLDLPNKKINIRRIQIEEDPARTQHIGGNITTSKYVLVDYNRSGTPLVEIVTEPDFSDPREARIFLQELQSILQYLEVFDPSVEGSMRVDANISVAKNRVEVKNISGFKDVEKALNYEIVRQNGLVRRNKEIEQETRGWDDAAGVTRSLRSKETEDDYGYIFEPDLTEITITKEKISETLKQIPELAKEKVKRYHKELKIAKDLAVSIVDDPDLAKAFEKVAKAVDAQIAAKWFAGEIKKTLNYNNLTFKATGLDHTHIEKLLKMIIKKDITEKTAEEILRKIVLTKEDPEQLARPRITDVKEIERYVKDALNDNPKALLDYKSGKKESLNFLVGQVMRKMKGQGDIETIRNVLVKIIGE